MLIRRSFRPVAIVAALILTAGACSSGSGPAASKPTPKDQSPSTELTSSAHPAAALPVTHIFVINLENENYATTWGAKSKAKYLNATLRKKGALLTKYYAIGHVSLDNYLAQISGQAPNRDTQLDCTTYSDFVSTGQGDFGQELGKGCVFPATVLTIADQLTVAGKTWKSYNEDIEKSATLPKTCRHPAIGAKDTSIKPTKTDMYATRHVPFVYFHSIIDTPACAAQVVGLTALPADLKTVATTANLTYITPNVCDDGHDAPCKDGRPGGLVSADKFLQTWVPKILASPAYKAGGMLVITSDEADLGKAGDSTACCKTPPSPNSPKPGLNGPGGGKVGALVISSRTKPNSTSLVAYNHYSLLCSMEDTFGLTHLGFAGAPGLACFGKDVYNLP